MAPGEIMISVVSVVLPVLGAMFMRKKCVAKKRKAGDADLLKNLSNRLDNLQSSFTGHVVSAVGPNELQKRLEEQATEYDKKINEIQESGDRALSTLRGQIVDSNKTRRKENNLVRSDLSDIIDARIKAVDDATRVEMAELIDKRVAALDAVVPQDVRKEVKQEIAAYDAAITRWTNNKLEGVRKDIQNTKLELSEKNTDDYMKCSENIVTLRKELKEELLHKVSTLDSFKSTESVAPANPKNQTMDDWDELDLDETL